MHALTHEDVEKVHGGCVAFGSVVRLKRTSSLHSERDPETPPFMLQSHKKTGNYLFLYRNGKKSRLQQKTHCHLHNQSERIAGNVRSTY